MAIVYFHGADGLGVPRDWELVTAETGPPVIGSGNGAKGTDSFHSLTSSDPFNVGTITNNSVDNKIFIAFTIEFEEIVFGDILSLKVGAGNDHFLRLQGSGFIESERYNGNVLGTTSMTFSVGVQYYFEYMVEMTTAADGDVELRVWTDPFGGARARTIEISLTGQDTSSGSGPVTNIGFNQSGLGDGVIIDDILVMDSSGSTFNGFLAQPHHMEYEPAAGNGTTNQFTGSDADMVDNYLLVDDAAPDGDSTYSQSAVVAERDEFLVSLTGDGSNDDIVAIKAEWHVRKTEESARGFFPLLRVAGSLTKAAVAKYVSTDYRRYSATYEVNPATSLPFQSTDIVQIGLEVI